MTYKDPEKQREYDRERSRRRRAANPEKIREANRKYAIDYRRRNPEKERERSRRYREANRDKRREYYEANREEILEKCRQRYAANKEKILKRNSAYQKKRLIESPEKVRAIQRRFRTANRDKILAANAVKRHGPHAADAWAAMWGAQHGCCYLCGQAMNPLRPAGAGAHLDTAVVDHDHRCCPPNASCSVCRRGIACNRCNTLIGLADDDPELLRCIVARLEAAAAAVTARLAAKPVQASLLDDDAG